MRTQAEQDAAAILKELDADSKERPLSGWRKHAYQIILMLFAVYALVSVLLLKGQTEFTKLPLFVGLSLFIGFL